MGWSLAHLHHSILVTRGTGLMAGRFCLGIGQEVHSIPALVPWELQQLMVPLFCFPECPGAVCGQRHRVAR